MVYAGWFHANGFVHNKRMNICGAINLATMNLLYQDFETINKGNFTTFLAKIRIAAYAVEHRIIFHYLQLHSPNLNAAIMEDDERIGDLRSVLQDFCGIQKGCGGFPDDDL
jgi:hypothetical protein